MSTTPAPFCSASTYHPFAEQEQRPGKQRGGISLRGSGASWDDCHPNIHRDQKATPGGG